MAEPDLLGSGVSSSAAGFSRRERRDAAAHRQRILTVARHLFEQAGVAAVSMHQIALAAGIGQGTLYRRYANKGDLCRDLIHEQHARFAKDVRAWMEQSAASPTLVRLDGILSRTLHFVNESVALLQAIVATEVRGLMCDELCDDALASRDLSPGQGHWFQWLHDLLVGLLAQAVADGEIAPLDTAYTADMLLFAMNPLYLRFLRVERGYSLDRILEGLRHIFISGIHTPTGPTECSSRVR
ncbi:MAG: TetR/AcrR family transcriptional regulator [Ktedonobacterales bacterium]|nr:TetR/AcrR family transcriptional regulator [Ktedonobacterales bacterium]